MQEYADQKDKLDELIEWMEIRQSYCRSDLYQQGIYYGLFEAITHAKQLRDGKL